MVSICFFGKGILVGYINYVKWVNMGLLKFVLKIVELECEYYIFSSFEK